MKSYIFLLLCFLFFFSCKNGKKENQNPDLLTDVIGPKSVLVDPMEEVELKVYINNLKLRKGSGVGSEEIMRLPENTILLFDGNTSMNYTKIKIREVEMYAPWLFVKTKNGQKGWVYAAGVKPNTNDLNKTSQIIDQIYLNSFFEEILIQQIKNYNTQFDAAKSSYDFAQVYLSGEKIQEKINLILVDNVQLDNPNNLLDMSWLERSMKGFQVSLYAEATTFHLFKNFKKMKSTVVQTIGEEDDSFIQLQFKANAQDSIEYDFKSWFLQTWDFGGHSLLGQSTHYEIIAEADDQIAKSKLFEQPIRQLVKEVMDDILNPNNTFWESQIDILQEMNAIISRDFDILTKENKIALKTRRKMFENSEANKIEFDKRER